MLICVTDYFDIARLISSSFPDYVIHFDHNYIKVCVYQAILVLSLTKVGGQCT